MVRLTLVKIADGFVPTKLVLTQRSKYNSCKISDRFFPVMLNQQLTKVCVAVIKVYLY